jgi:hypothetical protein
MSEAKGGAERRRARRRPIINTFSLFVNVPKKGVHRLKVHDVSELGIGFDLDTEGESAEDYPVAAGDTVDIRFYLNQSLFIPLSLEVIRVGAQGGVRRVGAEFRDKKDPGYQALASFLKMLDGILEVVRMDPQPAEV